MTTIVPTSENIIASVAVSTAGHHAFALNRSPTWVIERQFAYSAVPTLRIVIIIVRLVLPEIVRVKESALAAIYGCKPNIFSRLEIRIILMTNGEAANNT